MLRSLHFLLVAFLVAYAWYPRSLFAQIVDSPGQHQASELSDLLKRWDQAQDFELKIALADQLLVLERTLVSWPPDIDRQRVMGDLHFGLGSALIQRAGGVRSDNLEKAILHLETALPMWTREAMPRDWAMAHNNLGIAYWSRIQGPRADNQEKAAAHFEVALTVFTRDTYPAEWAQIQNNLAVMYWNRTHGERVENLEKAIRHFEAALTVLTRGENPHLWAMAQNNLGSAYRTRARGDRGDNREKAIAYLEAALTVFTREAYPHDWALAHNNLAISYLDRIEGNAAENKEKAIATFDAAMTIFTREVYPQEWAHAQHNLGVAYAGRSLGARADNRRKAIASYELALTVFTRDLDPRQHMRTSRLLARMFLDAGDWYGAAPHHASARDAFLLLFGEGFDEVETRSLIAEAGPMFAEAAFAAIQRGEIEGALGIASEGRARMLAVALKVRTLDMPPDLRHRVESVRASILTAQRAAETTEGVERAASIKKLVELRQELLGLIKVSDPTAGGSGSALAKAGKALAAVGAMAVPVFTDLGARIIVVSQTESNRNIGVISLPDDTSEKLFVLLRGPRDDPRLSGWLGAYFITQLPGAELQKRWPEWLAAVDDLGPQLWQLFGAKLDAYLKARGTRSGARLVFLPPGELGILPLGLAQDPKTKRRLADDYEIVYAPSLDALAAAHSRASKAAPATLAVVINPTGDLPGTEKEGEVVASYFSTAVRTKLERAAATPEAVLAALKAKTHWHFASHGTFVWQDPRQSALIMHGMERLSVGRLLETEGLDRPRLVVLSACETGLYDVTSNPDEFIGLPVAFSALGAAGVVGTLWPVSDAATALLIAKFYELHIGDRLSPPTALHRAQAWLRTATNRDLDAYAKAAGAKGRLGRRHLSEIEHELSAAGLARSRNSSVVEWIESNTTQTRNNATRGTQRAARPYAHPYFWAGFTYTGM